MPFIYLIAVMLCIKNYLQADNLPPPPPNYKSTPSLAKSPSKNLPTQTYIPKNKNNIIPQEYYKTNQELNNQKETQKTNQEIKNYLESLSTTFIFNYGLIYYNTLVAHNQKGNILNNAYNYNMLLGYLNPSWNFISGNSFDMNLEAIVNLNLFLTPDTHKLFGKTNRPHYVDIKNTYLSWKTSFGIFRIGTHQHFSDKAFEFLANYELNTLFNNFDYRTPALMRALGITTELINHQQTLNALKLSYATPKIGPAQATLSYTPYGNNNSDYRRGDIESQTWLFKEDNTPFKHIIIPSFTIDSKIAESSKLTFYINYYYGQNSSKSIFNKQFNNTNPYWNPYYFYGNKDIQGFKTLIDIVTPAIGLTAFYGKDTLTLESSNQLNLRVNNLDYHLNGQVNKEYFGEEIKYFLSKDYSFYVHFSIINLMANLNDNAYKHNQTIQTLAFGTDLRFFDLYAVQFSVQQIKHKQNTKSNSLPMINNNQINPNEWQILLSNKIAF